jgi:hypothetical protein
MVESVASGPAQGGHFAREDALFDADDFHLGRQTESEKHLQVPQPSRQKSAAVNHHYEEFSCPVPGEKRFLPGRSLFRETERNQLLC